MGQGIKRGGEEKEGRKEKEERKRVDPRRQGLAPRCKILVPPLLFRRQIQLSKSHIRTPGKMFTECACH